MLSRVLEPEAMVTLEEAVDYNSMDHSEVNRNFVKDLQAAGFDPAAGELLDLGTGTALIPVELCRQMPTAKVRAIDLSASMLKIARQNVEAAGFSDRLILECIDAKELPYSSDRFSAVISNSIVHHIPYPKDVLAEMWRVLTPGGLIFVRDLLRPKDDAEVLRHVESYAKGTNRHQKQMLEDSFRAALRIEEIQDIMADLGQNPNSVRITSDRHWTWTERK